MSDTAGRTFLLALLLVAGAVVATNGKAYRPADSVLLNCGSTSDGLDADGRNWVADTNNQHWLVDGGKSSIMAAADRLETLLPSTIPYMTARVFTVETAYNFTVNPMDRHWLRFLFYPSSYNGIAPENFRFSVSTSTGLVLLRNFSVWFTTKALTQAYLIEEFSLPRAPAGFFTVTFTPTPMSNSNNVTYAYVNGIEVSSMPDIFDDPVAIVGFADQTVDIATTQSIPGHEPDRASSPANHKKAELFPVSPSQLAAADEP